jgi:hypothetical protein
MVTAYILIQTEVGKAAQVATDIIDITGVQQAQAVAGPYDVIVRAPRPATSTSSASWWWRASRRCMASPGPSPVRSCTSHRRWAHRDTSCWAARPVRLSGRCPRARAIGAATGSDPMG